MKLAEENNNVSEQIASTVIHEKATGGADSEVTLKNKRGRPLRVKLNPKTIEKKVISTICLHTGQASARLGEAHQLCRTHGHPLTLLLW